MTNALLERSRKKAPKPPERKRLDPVTSYARAVIDGRIVAGRAVRQACGRHLRDLARQRTKAFPYYFNERAARHVIDFFPAFLTLENGDPFVLPPWLKFSYGSIFGWKRVDDDMRRFQHGYFETSKGSGKTPSAGGIALYGAGYDDEEFAEIYSTGFDKGQASIILNDAIRMAENSPEESFRAEFFVGKYNIAHPGSGSYIRAMSSQHQSKSGPRPHYVLSDEIHEHRDGTVVGKAESGFKNRPQPLGLKYTNSGSDKASYCWQLHQKSLSVLEGTIQDEQWFAYVCHLDPCQGCYDDGYRQPKDGCQACDDWTDPKVWPKIAPALGIVIQPKYLQDQIDKALSMPSEYALVRRLNFCVWTETHQIWIAADRWDACKVPQFSGGRVSACAAGLDMSEKLDLTAAVIARRVDDPLDSTADSLTITEMEGEREVSKTLDLNFCVEIVTFFWIPEETMLARVRNERIPYDAWARQGYVRVSPGPIVDHDKIYQEFTTEICPTYRPTVIGYDPHNATQFGAALRDRARLNAVEVPQGRRLSEAFKWFEALVQAKRIRHIGNPTMSWCVANCEAKYDRHRNLWVEKPSATKRIDGAIAAVEALSLLLAMPRQPQFQMIVLGGKR
jgi:phage terminase large subunit-like protein